MNDGPLTRDERDGLLARLRVARALYERSLDAHVAWLDRPGELGIDEGSLMYVDTPAYAQARASHAEMVAIESEYFRRLPRVVMAACPFCARPLYRAFDPHGLEGLWWRSDAQPEEPPACPHFCVLVGAVSLGGHAPRPDFDVHPGPGVPFVLPRLLGHPGMIAVVAELPMVDGAVGFPVAYFAPRRPPVQALAAPWARSNHVYTTQLGEHGWRAADGLDAWDFSLDGWEAQLRWCPPGGDRTVLANGAGPFRDRPGVRAPQQIRRSCEGGDPR